MKQQGNITWHCRRNCKNVTINWRKLSHLRVFEGKMRKLTNWINIFVLILMLFPENLVCVFPFGRLANIIIIRLKCPISAMAESWRQDKWCFPGRTSSIIYSHTQINKNAETSGSMDVSVCQDETNNNRANYFNKSRAILAASVCSVKAYQV